MIWDGTERRKEIKRDACRMMDKETIKEALKEWLNEKFATFGRWSLTGLAAMALAGLIYLWMMSNGWHK